MTAFTSLRRNRVFLALVALLVAVNSITTRAQHVSSQQRLDAVQRALERLPGYGVFDFLAFSIDRGTVTLAGYAYNGSLKDDAVKAVKRVAGVDDVINTIEILPASLNDDRIRQATFYRIYSDSFLSRYVAGGPRSVFYEAVEFRRFPGRQPFGTYPIHIIVEGGRTTLLGMVDSPADKQLAEFRAREISGVFEVTNDIVVTRRQR